MSHTENFRDGIHAAAQAVVIAAEASDLPAAAKESPAPVRQAKKSRRHNYNWAHVFDAPEDDVPMYVEDSAD
jgi:hypothetical protein